MAEKTSHHKIHEKKTGIVVLLTAVAMVTEIFFGYWTQSMALLADGYHMASHVLALGLSWLAYYFSRKYASSDKYTFNKKKLLSFSGFTSAILLLIVAITMAFESFLRLITPMEINFKDAIYVAIIGLIVNIICAFILHHKHEHSDYNIRSAYLHVLADALTSIMAIIALTLGLYFNLYSLDAITGIISSIVITKWAIGLIKNSGKEIIEFVKKTKH